MHGTWHLGAVISACLASLGHNVTGLGEDETNASRLAQGHTLVFEPGLADLVKHGLAAGNLRFTSDIKAVADADVNWIAYDTPVDEEDCADVEYVLTRVRSTFPYLRPGSMVLVSSQLPVGTIHRLENDFATVRPGVEVSFACSPENLRLGKAIEVFLSPDRVVVGIRSESDKGVVQQLLAPVTDRIEWMSVESAEMTKHALNAWLATSVTFINEIAEICEQTGADATEVERGLKSEARVGPKAYLSPGGAFAGGTLARDIMFLSQLGRKHGVSTHLLSSVRVSNQEHRGWAARWLDLLLDGVGGKAIAVWGLTYKAGTDTLRRSSSVELCNWLVQRGSTVRAHDPAVKALPPALAQRITLVDDPLSAVDGASALVVSTPWPDYQKVSAVHVMARMKNRLTLDANRFLKATLGSDPSMRYLSVGKGGL